MAFSLYAGIVLTLLIAPGPTNALLATSGATVGVLRSFPLLIAPVAGYVTAAVVLGRLISPSLLDRVEIRRLLALAVAAWLLALAVSLWSANQLERRPLASFCKLWLTALLNPKGVIIALVLLPSLRSDAILRVFTLAAIAAVTGTAWIVVGALAGRLIGRRSARIVPRLAAAGLTAFACVLVGSMLVQ